MTAAAVLRYFGSLKGLSGSQLAQCVPAWLERIDLAAHAGKKVEELSRGMHQKLQFAATVINDPELVILDEPFSGLDPVNQDLLREIITTMRDQGRTVLFSTHGMHEAEELCDFIVLINQGRWSSTARWTRSGLGTSPTRSRSRSGGDGALWGRCPRWRRSGPTGGGWT
jgi:ABC-2 type transport system ATP-binding protein